MGTSVIGNLDSQVWKMLGIDTEDTNDKNNKNNEEENSVVKENKSGTKEEQLRKD
ncbi:MAG: hypothetical protein AB9836_13830 [Aminipila sp.]